jgi:hypothetical protein
MSGKIHVFHVLYNFRKLLLDFTPKLHEIAIPLPYISKEGRGIGYGCTNMATKSLSYCLK